jgi:cell wall-associated NlpC family hydrolase
MPALALSSAVARLRVPPAVARWTGAAIAAIALIATFAFGTSSAHADNPSGPHDPIGKINTVRPAKHAVTFVGWTYDPDAPTRNATVLGVVDGRVVAHGPTNVVRPNVTKRHHTGATPGFVFSVPVPTGHHTACLAARDIAKGVTRVLDCVLVPLGRRLDSTQLAHHSPSGQYSSATAGSSTMTVTGFAKEPDMLRRRVTVVLYVDGVSSATVTTRRATPAQVGAGSAPYGAFDFSVPVSSGAHLGCIWLVDVGLGSNTTLGCDAVDTRGPAGTGRVKQSATRKTATDKALRQIGKPYVWGAVGPKSFDCSGLVLWSYHKAGVTTPRIAADQFGAAHLIPAARAARGDLIFYHDSVGHVYHVGIYLSPGRSVAAIDEAEGVNYQTIYTDSYATYGSFTHR